MSKRVKYNRPLLIRHSYRAGHSRKWRCAIPRELPRRAKLSVKEMERRIALILVVICVSSMYAFIFVVASIHTKPSQEDALYEVKSGLFTYYTNSPGAWTPFERYHSTFSGGYYSRDFLGRWALHEKELKLGGTVSISTNG